MCESSKISAEKTNAKVQNVGTIITMKVTLEELYSGNRRCLQIIDETKCLSCKYTTLIQGPTASLKCRMCFGSGRQTRKILIIVNIRRGMVHGDKIIFEGVSIRQKGFEKLIVKLDEQEHPVFKRRGNNIHMDMPLKMQEKEYGYKYTIKTIDGRTLSITYTGERRDTILGEGIPIYGRKRTGALIVNCSNL